jgi:hypothetical protein
MRRLPGRPATKRICEYMLGAAISGWPDLLRPRLNSHGALVTWADMDSIGLNPARLIDTIQLFAGQHRGRVISCVQGYAGRRAGRSPSGQRGGR